ncbi:PRD domain-containing protein [Streptobacillus moniliformis]|uniref:Transcriptional antiterminator, BglG n=1 Tax=Streptobacillus moniliformis (strain ATCC 14647 / DSM 12112 / NCTC 10651 / 9901) TaxID=519441 RepID=D1AV48_STRM9|nr:PTS sugar transporter subunit IIA [Streptobacillus moniliformis]ACZ01608.1 transcriptional antiterminator, BglG [Streptobacillus moniliformis DSM 12112]AVL43394.1 PRD domain-containing protein [Streptobacillus moniliformis]SQA13219.1 Probable licABCH operon regulator [Streptobacillus moniliformis]
MINEREIRILERLLEENVLNLENICEYFRVSKRTIQYNLNNINYFLSKKGFSKIGIKNGNILISSKLELKEFLESIKDKEYISRDDRITLIYLYALYNKNGLNISSLSKKIDISRNTLKLDMNLLDGEKFQYIYSRGYFLDWTNNKKIEFLDEIYNKKSLQKYIKEVIDFEIMKKVENFLKTLSVSIKLNINEEIYQKLIITIYTMIKFPEKNNTSTKFSLDEEMGNIKEIFVEYFGSHSSFEKIAEMLIGLSINPNFESWLDESFLIKKMIKSVGDEIGIDLTEDKILYDFLLTHIKVSIYRLKKGIKLKNSIYQQLVLENNPIIPIIKASIVEMEEIFEIKFTEIEISLIAYHFKASIERMKTFNRKKVILVCGLGYGTSRILEYNLKEKFDIDIVDVIPAYMIDKINLNSVDYIISTIDLENFDFIKINPLLNVEDYEKLDKLGIKRRQDKVLVDDLLDEIENNDINFDRNKLKNTLLDKFSNILVDSFKSESKLIKALNKNSVIFRKNVSNWEEAIELLGNNLVSKCSITNEYIDEMKKMVKKLGPYIVIYDGIALPHAKFEHSVMKTDASLLILEEAVDFGKGKKAKVLLCFSSKDNNSHLELLGDFYKLILNEKFLEDISRIKTYEKLMSYFKEKI